MYVMITLSSITSAKRIERALKEMGIMSQTMHTPKIVSQNGCSHSVRLKRSDIGTALKICKETGINVRGVYAEKTTGKGKTEYEKIG